MSKVKAKKNSRLGRNGAELGQEGLSFTDGNSKLHSEKVSFFLHRKILQLITIICMQSIQVFLTGIIFHMHSF